MDFKAYQLGKLINDALMSSILFDREVHEKFITFLSGVLLDTILEKIDIASVKQSWDRNDEIYEKIQNLECFQQLLTIQPVQEEEIEQPNSKLSHHLDLVKNNKELRQNFATYLKKRTAKSKASSLSDKTVICYVSAIFSETKSHSFVSWCHRNGREPWQYMFNSKGCYYNLPENIDEIVMAGEQSASSAKNICNGVQALLKFFRGSAQKIQMSSDASTESYKFLHQNAKYTTSIDILSANLTEQNSRLDAEVKKAIKISQRQETFLDPGEAEKQANAFPKYFRGKTIFFFKGCM